MSTGNRAAAPSAPAPTPSLARFLGPRYWGIWLGVGLLRVAVLLPFRLQWLLGRGLGNLLRVALPARRRIAAINLALCFPAASPAERDTWLREHFHSLGMALFDFGLARWASPARAARLVRVTGLEHIAAARAAGHGVVLLTGHFPAAELGGRALQAALGRMAALYRPIKNPLVNELARRARAQGTEILIPKDNMRQLVRALRQGYAVYFAPDQSDRRAHSALLPFFGEPAMTNTALSQIVRLSGARVIPMVTRRRADGGGYDAILSPPLQDFPGESPEADARRTLALLEQAIRAAPAQYYWIHRRFKGRPAPLPDPYAADAPAP